MDPNIVSTNVVPKLLLSENIIQAAAIRAKLGQPIDLSLNATPWSDVEELLENKLKLNIVLTRSAIDDSLSQDEPIFFTLRDSLKDLNFHLASK